MINPENTSALILAAGYSSRMGSFKPLAKLGPMTAAERCINLFISAGVSDIRVVTGHRHAEIAELLDKLNVRHVLNPNFDEGMFSSVTAGLSSLESSSQAFFILPVDIPLVRKSSILQLLRAFDPIESGVVYPCFWGKRGHPPLINGELIREILKFDGNGGLRGYLKQKMALNLEVPDENILTDMDLPQQYQALVNRLIGYDIPSRSECLSFLKYTMHLDEALITKTIKIAQIAGFLVSLDTDKGLAPRQKFLTAYCILTGVTLNGVSNEELVQRLVENFGDSELSQLMSRFSWPDTSGSGNCAEFELVNLAGRILDERDAAKVDMWLDQYSLEEKDREAILSLKSPSHTTIT